MPGRNQKPRRWLPSGLTDAVDGSDSFAGAMSSLQNLVRQPNSNGIFVPRPAFVALATIPDATGQLTALKTLGNVAYGFAPSASSPGLDKPFMFNAAAGAFITISGMSASNLPTTQPTTGDWTPPSIDEITARVIFTHPGFAGGPSQPPNLVEFMGGTTNASSNINGPFAFTDAIGNYIRAANVPNNTTVVSAAANIVNTTATYAAGASSITVASTTGIYVGQAAFGPGISSIVTGISGTNVTVNGGASISGSAVSVTFNGTTIQMSQNATGTTAQELIFMSSTVSNKFGWLDLSGFSTSGVVGNTIGGVPAITGNPNLTGIQPGMSITGPNIPPNTLVTQANTFSYQAAFGLVTNSNVLDLFAEFTPDALDAGQSISGVGIPLNTFITNVNFSTLKVTISQAATATTALYLTVSGAFILLNNNASASLGQATFAFAGGTPQAPLWGAGDLNINPLASTGPAIAVAQFSNRAYFAVNAYPATGTVPLSVGVQASDAGLPCQQTNISQTLTFNNGIPVNALAGLGLSTQLGGIIQSLMVFQGDSNIQQITGDFASHTIAVNPLQTATGTLAPNSIAPTPKGLMFVATDGLRMITFDGSVTDPIGTYGKGISLPFINAQLYSRIAAAFNENVYRVTVSWIPPMTVASVWGTALRTDEFWFHVDIGKWSGPHASIMDMIAPLPLGNTFIASPHSTASTTGGAILTDDAGFALTDDSGFVLTDDSMGASPNAGILFRSDVNPSSISVYTELGAQLACTFTTVLLPDNPGQMAIGMTQTTIFVGVRSGEQELLVTATDDMGQTLNQAYVVIGPFSAPAQRPIPWTSPLVFRQIRISLSATASSTLQLGALNLRDEVLGYQLPYPVAQEWLLGHVPTEGALGP
jgi:hypothetical protein